MDWKFFWTEDASGETIDDMTDATVRLAAARYVLGLMTTDEAVRLANKLLDGGVYNRGLGELVTRRFYAWPDAESWFKLAMHELGVPVADPAATTYLERREAAFIVFKHQIIELIEGRMSPGEAAFGLPDLVTRMQVSADELGCRDEYAPLLRSNLEYAWDIAEASGEIDELERQLFKTAEGWLRRNYGRQIERGWISPTISDIARGIATDRAFDRLPILADALEEAGCSDREILDHCRQPGEHVRGCWVVDLILGKK